MDGGVSHCLTEGQLRRCPASAGGFVPKSVAKSDEARLNRALCRFNAAASLGNPNVCLSDAAPIDTPVTVHADYGCGARALRNVL